MDVKEKLREGLKSVSGRLNEAGFSSLFSWRRALLVLIFVLPAFFLPSYFTAFVLMVLTVVMSLLVNRFGLNRFGLELTTFSTVTMAYVFGPNIGALLGMTYITLQLFSGNTPGVYLIWVLPSYVAAGYITGGLGMDIVTLGIYTSIALQSFFTFMTFLMSRSRLPKFIQYTIFNITFNILLFQTIATPLVTAIG